MFGIGKRRNSHVTDLLSAYMDNELTSRERARVEAHIRECPACAEDLRSLQATVQGLRTLPAVAAPRSFILQPTYQPRRASPLLPVLRLATSVVALVLVVTLVGDVWMRSTPLPTAPAPEAAAIDTAAGIAQTSPQPFKAGEVAPTGTLAPATAPVALSASPATGITEAAKGAALTSQETPTPQPRVMAPAPAVSALGAATPQATATSCPTATATPTSPPTATRLPLPTPVAGTAVPLRPLQIGLGALLALLLVATLLAGRRPTRRRPES